MGDSYDFVVVWRGFGGCGDRGRGCRADPGCRVALLEAGDLSAAAEAMRRACASLQVNPETDDVHGRRRPGGLGLAGRPDDGPARQDAGRDRRASTTWPMCAAIRVTSMRGLTLGQRLGRRRAAAVFVRARAWHRAATFVVDFEAHNTEGCWCLGPRPRAAGRTPVRRCRRGRRHPDGRLQRPRSRGRAWRCLPPQTTTRDGKRASTYHVFLEGEAEGRRVSTSFRRCQATGLGARGRSPWAPGRRALSIRTAAGEPASSTPQRRSW